MPKKKGVTRQRVTDYLSLHPYKFTDLQRALKTNPNTLSRILKDGIDKKLYDQNEASEYYLVNAKYTTAEYKAQLLQHSKRLIPILELLRAAPLNYIAALIIIVDDDEDDNEVNSEETDLEKIIAEHGKGFGIMPLVIGMLASKFPQDDKRKRKQLQNYIHLENLPVIELYRAIEEHLLYYPEIMNPLFESIDRMFRVDKFLKKRDKMMASSEWKKLDSKTERTETEQRRYDYLAEQLDDLLEQSFDYKLERNIIKRETLDKIDGDIKALIRSIKKGKHLAGHCKFCPKY